LFDAPAQLAPQNDQLMSERGIFGLKPDLRLEWRGQGGQNETQKPDHSASLGDSITSSTRIAFSVHTRNEKEKLTALLHHVSIDVLRWAFFNIKKQAAPGVDGLTWVDYAADLDPCTFLPAPR
jgi:hypothetical protein